MTRLSPHASLRPSSRLGLILTSALVLAGCGQTGQERSALPLTGRGTTSEPFTVGNFSVVLSEARIGIGPIYACASSRSSSDLCPAAVAEFSDAAELDGLDAEAQPLGELAALSASARSIGLDYAITWPTSAPQPVTLPAAPERHSARFAGRADDGTRSFEFSVELDIAPLLRGTRAVEGLSTRVDLATAAGCELSVDPIAWWSQIDFAELSQQEGDAIVIDSDSAAYATLVTAMTSNATPRFAWSRATRR